MKPIYKPQGAAKEYGNYTIDVGVLTKGETVVIEVHNFVSCGLYGFDRPVLLQMLNNGFKKELKETKVSH